MAATLAPPVSFVKRVTPLPEVTATNTRQPLSEVLLPGCPTVIHLFTG